MKRGFTLLEMIVTIVILGILSAGTFVSLQHLYLRSAKSKALSDLSAESQVIVDQISALMYDRVPSSVIGYDGLVNFQSIYALDNNFTVLEWIGVASESHKLRAYSGFIDMNDSNKTTFKISTAGVNEALIVDTVGKKFKDGNIVKMGLIFAGSFDDGAMYYSNEFNNTFGWHDANTTAIKISNFSVLPDGNIKLNSNVPDEIYEKYYLVDSAYALARGQHINQSAQCIIDLNNSIGGTITDINNTLFLFYNYRPWENSSDTFCADKSKISNDSNVTILSKNVSGFEAGVINGTIYFNITMLKKIGNDYNVTISKQKAVY